MRIRLLGGLLLWVTTLYCGPAVRTGKGRGREGAGLYPELAVLGFQEGTSAALASLVARTTALLPSYAVANRELAQRGLVIGCVDLRCANDVSDMQDDVDATRGAGGIGRDDCGLRP